MLYLAPSFCGWGNFAGIVGRKKITLDFLCFGSIFPWWREMFLEPGLSSVCLKNNAAFNTVISEEFAYEL